MKKIVLVLVLVFLSLTSLHAQMSYYYHRKKVNLTVDRNYINVIVDEDFMNSTMASQTFQKFNMEQNESRAAQGIVKMKFKSAPDMLKYSEIVKLLKQNKQIKCVLPFFERGGDVLPIGTSDIFYIQLKNAKDTELLKKIAEGQGVQIIKQIPYMPEWYILSIKNSIFTNSIDATNYFYETGQFEEVDPAFMFDFKPSCTNDPMFGQLWGLKTTSSITNVGINVCDAWSISRGSGIKVAIVDEGIDPNHNDLSANFHALSFDAKSGTSPSVYNSNLDHGTHVAGIIAAARNNGLQVVGVAPESQILRVSHNLSLPNPTISAELASGISWAWNPQYGGADVINCSWGDQGNAIDLHSTALENSIVNALSSGRNNKGCVVVFASGNFEVIDYPASFHSEILCVGAIESNGQRRNSSGYGYQLDIVAPGGSILSTINNNGTGSKSGTSFAAPHVAGVAALILSVSPNLTGLQVRNAIESTAQKVGSGYTYQTKSDRSNGTYHDQMGYGLVNAYAAIKSVLPTITGTSLICTSGSTTFTAINWQTGYTWAVSSNLSFWGASNTNSTVSISPAVSYYLPGEPGWVSLRNFSGTELFRKEVWVGIPAPTIRGSENIYTPWVTYPVEYYYADYNPLSNITSFYWNMVSAPPNNNESYYSNLGSDKSAMVRFPADGIYRLSLAAFNACGHSLGYPATLDIDVAGTGYYSMSYPNPASDILNIEIDAAAISRTKALEQTTTGGKQLKIDPAYDIRLYDYQGNLLRNAKTKGGTVQFNVANLPNGIYYLHVYDGVNEKPEMRQIVVEH